MKKEERIAYNKAIMDVEEYIEHYLNEDPSMDKQALEGKIEEILNELRFTYEELED